MEVGEAVKKASRVLHVMPWRARLDLESHYSLVVGPWQSLFSSLSLSFIPSNWDSPSLVSVLVVRMLGDDLYVLEM